MEIPKSQERPRGKLKEPKTCRIFFSSPFGGMEEEREELTRKYFPQIHHACNAKGIQFVAVDMRWGITSQAAENAQVINICLREADRSDIFVGFFGQRYGWHGADDKQLQENFDNAVRTYPWLDTVRDRSVTELEFLHGHLNQPGVLPACLCFRDKAYDDMQREEGLAKGDKKQVFKYSSESEHATTMMDDLKKRVKDTESKCLGVNMAYTDPHEGARFMFESIWPYLTEVLLANTDTVTLSKREQQLEEHDAFRARHITLYQGGQTYMDFLNKKLAEGQGSILVLGSAGSGKSAMLSNWTVQVQASSPDTLLIYHFLGCAPGTTEERDILSRLVSELRHALEGIGDDSNKTPPAQNTQKDKEGAGEDILSLQTSLLRAVEELRSCQPHRRLVIVLDGLDRSPQAGKITKHLYWLPKEWPSGVLFIASTVDTDKATFDLLVTERHYETLTIQPLGEGTQREICLSVLKKSGKELSEEQLGRVVAAPQTSNPLYLRLVLSELSIFGYFRLLDKKIDSLIYNADVGELLQKMFTRLEEDYNGKETNTRLVQQVLCAIALSKHGLQEKEVMEMLGVLSHDWLPLFFAMEGLLISHAGLLRFGFAEISEAVKAKYLQDEEEKMRMLKMLTGYFNKKLQSIPICEDLLTPLAKRPVQELPWLQLAAGDLEGLSDTLVNIFTLQHMRANSEYEFFELWKRTGQRMAEVCDRYLQAFDLAIADLYLYQQHLTSDPSTLTPPGFKLRPLLESIFTLMDMASFPEGAVKVHLRNIDLLIHLKGAIPSMERFLSMKESNYALACALVDCRKFIEGQKAHCLNKESLQMYLEEHPEDVRAQALMGQTSNGIGVIYVKQKRWDEAIAMFEESLKYHSLRNDTKHVAICHTNLGSCHMETGDLQLALTHQLKALKIYEELFFGHLPVDIGNLLTNIGICCRRMGNFEEAETYYLKSLKIKANAMGWDHDVVALAYMNLGSLNMFRDDHEKAEHYLRKALDIHEGNGASLDKTEYLQTSENLVGCLLSQKKYQEALPVYLPIFRKLVEHGNMDNCIPSIHRDMAKYMLQEGDTRTAREITVALLKSRNRNQSNYIFLDHLQSILPKDQRPQLPEELTLDYALEKLWPGDPDLTRWVMEHHALPAGDVDKVLTLQAVCAQHNPQWGAYTYQACAEWCMAAECTEAAVRVLEEGTKDYPEDLNLRLQILDLCRKMGEQSRSYHHLPLIIEQRKDDPGSMILAGDAALHADDFDLALQCFDLVVTLDNPDLAAKAKQIAENVRRVLAENSGGGTEDAADRKDHTDHADQATGHPATADPL